ncbi:DUF2516 family protein [Allonocardiopsis opalescens]|uniref:Uncharacterized protein DUF2516 n=1 Tax=Allonocardiopsis opalescens TaxID=1144618 RepID=A0A2T0QAA8_9ACTN|nr:DUF2516 family protein [Allonocardiopsis opalescens]PRY00750.1 uncharacterized protein DUF2516 [Allonocardiopsis opalescens]
MQFVVYLFWALAIAAFVVELVALVEAVRTPASAYTAASKMTKQIWLIILGIATVCGLAGAVQMISPIGFLTVGAFVAGCVFLVDVRPAVKPYRGKSGGSNNGPYGPW